MIELEFGEVGFCGGKKLENQEKNSCGKVRTNQNLKPTLSKSTSLILCFSKFSAPTIAFLAF